MLRVCKVGSLTPHPLGIIRLRPEAHRLVLRLIDEPYVIRYWAESLLPVQHKNASDDPRDQISGVWGLRYSRSSAGIALHRPVSNARIVLTGFNRRWWDRIASDIKANHDALFTQPHWTSIERKANALTQKSRCPEPARPPSVPLTPRQRS